MNQDLSNRIISFPPIADTRTKVLILGSMPGVKSLQSQQYYAHPHNHFWRIIYGIFDLSPDSDYDRRVLFLKTRGIGLWDVLASCSRPGSLDANIKNEITNNVAGFLNTYSTIENVVFNGSKAWEIFKRKIGMDKFPSISFHRLPSTSPANTEKYEQKLQEWRRINSFLTQFT